MRFWLFLFLFFIDDGWIEYIKKNKKSVRIKSYHNNININNSIVRRYCSFSLLFIWIRFRDTLMFYYYFLHTVIYLLVQQGRNYCSSILSLYACIFDGLFVIIYFISNQKEKYTYTVIKENLISFFIPLSKLMRTHTHS